MAFISIKNGVVGKSINGKGFIVVDRFTKRDGEVIDTEYAIWVTDNAPKIPAEGSIVNVSGGYSDKIDEFGDKAKIARSVRAYKVEPVVNDAPF